MNNKYKYLMDIENQFFIIDNDDDNISNINNNTDSSLYEIILSKLSYNYFYSLKFKKSKSYPNNIIDKSYNNKYKNSNKILNDGNIELYSFKNPIISTNINSDDNYELIEIKNNKNSNYVIKIYEYFNFNKIKLLNKLLSIFLHIFIMIVFEIYFYFNYVVEIEKNEFLNKIKTYLHEFENNIDLNTEQKKIIVNILKLQYNGTFMEYLYNEYIKSLKQQNKLLHKLFIRSCSLGSGIGFILIALIVLSIYNKKKIKWNSILFENIIMFILLGIFEYLFFINIILNYNPITDAEVKYFVAKSLVNYFNSTNN